MYHSFLFIHVLKEIWAVYSSWQLQIHSEHLYTGFCVGVCFHFSRLNTQVQLLGHMLSVCSAIFQSGYTSFHFHQQHRTRGPVA